MQLTTKKRAAGKRPFMNSRKTILLCCWTLLALGNARAAPESLRTQILALQQLSVSRPDAALTQLQTLQQQQSNMRQADLRELLRMQIELNIDRGNKKEAVALIGRLNELGRQSVDQVEQIMTLNFQARMLGDEARYGEGLVLIERALPLVRQRNDSLLTSQIESTAGELYGAIGNFQVALQHHLGGLGALDNVKEKNWLADLYRARSLNYIGRLYLALKETEPALNYLAKAHDLAEHLNAPGLLSSIANNRGYAYADQEKWALAIPAYEESLLIARQVGNHSSEAKSLNNLADASLNLKKYPDCVRYAEQSVAIAHGDGLSSIDAVAQTNLGVCHIYMGQFEKGVAENSLGLDFARRSQAKPALEGMLSDLVNAYEKTGHYKEALKALQEKDRITSELFLSARDRSMIEMEVHFDLSQRQKEIEKLEQKNLLQKVEIENRNLQRIIAILAIVSVIVTLGFIFNLYKRVRASNQKLRAANLKLKYQTTRDPLTGLLNRRAFQHIIDSFNDEAQPKTATGTGLHDVLILLDIDHFKQVNDNYGHLVGDLVLIELGRRLQKFLREKDMLMRWGGEEFLIYLHQVPADKVALIIQRELEVVGSTPIRQPDAGQASVSVTISAGYILMPLPGAGESDFSWDNALHLVDLALYFAKANGRNQAVGIESVQGSKEQVDALIAGDLQSAVDSGVVVLQRIRGMAKDTDLL